MRDNAGQVAALGVLHDTQHSGTACPAHAAAEVAAAGAGDAAGPASATVIAVAEIEDGSSGSSSGDGGAGMQGASGWHASAVPQWPEEDMREMYCGLAMVGTCTCTRTRRCAPQGTLPI